MEKSVDDAVSKVKEHTDDFLDDDIFEEEDFTEAVKETAEDMAEEAAEKAEDIKEEAEEKVQTAAETVKDIKDEIKEEVKEEEKEALRTDLIGLAAEYAPISIIGSGGNINKLFRLADKKDKKASLLPVESLREIYEALQAIPAEQRIKQYKLKPDRADVIVPAA